MSEVSTSEPFWQSFQRNAGPKASEIRKWYERAVSYQNNVFYWSVGLSAMTIIGFILYVFLWNTNTAVSGTPYFTFLAILSGIGVSYYASHNKQMVLFAFMTNMFTLLLMVFGLAMWGADLANCKDGQFTSCKDGLGVSSCFTNATLECNSTSLVLGLVFNIAYLVITLAIGAFTGLHLYQWSDLQYAWDRVQAAVKAQESRSPTVKSATPVSARGPNGM